MKPRTRKWSIAIAAVLVVTVGVGLALQTQAWVVETTCHGQCPHRLRVVDRYGEYYCNWLQTCSPSPFGGETCDYQPLDQCLFVPNDPGWPGF